MQMWLRSGPADTEGGLEAAGWALGDRVLLGGVLGKQICGDDRVARCEHVPYLVAELVDDDARADVASAGALDHGLRG